MHMENQAGQPRGMDRRGDVGWPVLALVLAAITFNGFLAIINAHVTTLGFWDVAAAEIFILFLGLLVILVKGIRAGQVAVFLFLIFTLGMAAYVTLINKQLYIDYFRNILILSIFCMLGYYVNAATLKKVVLWSVSIVFGVLMLEVFYLNQYGDLFYPAKYFEDTRGLEQISLDGTKLFQNAQRVPGRFTFGIINHRSSSIFLEQVSNANFSGVLMIYLIALWKRFSAMQLGFILATIILIILTNDTRTMILFSVICLTGYFVFPKLPRLFALMVMPLVLIAGGMIYLLMPDAVGDNIPGRIVLTITKFGELSLPDVLGFAAETAPAQADSGYIYVIVIGTIFSLILLWLFVSFYPRCGSAAERRYAHALSIFIFMNLLIGGTAIFSIKIAALLWLLAGHLARGETVSENAETEEMRHLNHPIPAR